MEQVAKPILLKNAKYYTPEGIKGGHILLNGGKIAHIFDEFDAKEDFSENFAEEKIADSALQVYDVSGRMVLPGAIDTHVHVREPGNPEKEDFLTGTAAAVAGGVTTICQMPNVNPAPHNAATLANCMQLARQKALCNVVFYAAAGADNTADFADMLDMGAVGLKTFLQPGKPGEPQYITVGQDDGDEELCRVLSAAATLGARCYFHCEDYRLIGKLEAEAHKEGLENFAFHYKTRPDEAELLAVLRVLAAAKKCGTKVGLVHVSTAAVADLVALMRGCDDSVDVTVEVCFHHLFFDESQIDKFGPYAKCNPPLRSVENVQGLWQYVLNGTVDYIGSDHAPHTPEQKKAGIDAIWQAPSGIAHIELMLPLMLTAVNDGYLTLERMAELCCVNGYRAMGLYPQKGLVAEGADADLIVVDMSREWRFDSAKMQTKARKTCRLFDGLAMKGAVEATIVGGKIVYADGVVDYTKQACYFER